MKLTYPIVIAIAGLLLARGASAQSSDEGKMFAKNWLSLNCAESVDAQSEHDNFLKHRNELKAYFLAAVQRGLELDGLREEEADLGDIYDQNIRQLNEHKPGWVTPEYESKIRSITKEAFIARAKEGIAQNYKERALKGLEMLRSLPGQ